LFYPKGSEEETHGLAFGCLAVEEGASGKPSYGVVVDDTVIMCEPRPLPEGWGKKGDSILEINTTGAGSSWLGWLCGCCGVPDSDTETSPTKTTTKGGGIVEKRLQKLQKRILMEFRKPSPQQQGGEAQGGEAQGGEAASILPPSPPGPPGDSPSLSDQVPQEGKEEVGGSSSGGAGGEGVALPESNPVCPYMVIITN